MTSRQYLLRLKSVFFSIIFAAILVGGLSFYMLHPFNGLANGQSLYFMMGFAATIFSLLLFLLLNKQKNQEATEHKILSDKLMAFQNGYLTTTSLLLGPAILNHILYGIGGPTSNFYMGLFLTVILLSRFPSINIIANSLGLKEKDIQSLKDDHFKII